MTNQAIGTRLCCLCGKAIERAPRHPGDVLSLDHVPPLQFYPKEIRKTTNLNLWRVPMHKRCNEDYRKDEEYFYYALYAAVQTSNPPMGQALLRDLRRRTGKPQMPAMMRRILKDVSRVRDGGIDLPAGTLRVNLDQFRTERVVRKIAQGLFYLEHQRYLARENCKEIRLCDKWADVPELYRLSWQGADAKYVLPEVFLYRYFQFDGMHLFSLLFWEAFMFCTRFVDP